jgi:hypothetical protein
MELASMLRWGEEVAGGLKSVTFPVQQSASAVFTEINVLKPIPDGATGGLVVEPSTE